MRSIGDDAKITGVTFGAVTSKSNSLLIIRTSKGTFRVRITRSERLRTAGVRDLRDAIVGAVNQVLDLSKL